MGWVAAPLALSALCALRLSLGWMRRVRHLASEPMPPRNRSVLQIGTTQRNDPATISPTHWISAFFLLALRRGPAIGTAWALVTGVLVVLTCGIGTLSPMLGLGWPLAVLALAALISTSALRARSSLDLLPLQQATAHLPLPRGRWHRARTALTLIPVIVGLLTALPGMLVAPGLRPLAVLAYVLVVGLGCAWEAAKDDKPSHRAARWLLTLVLAIAIGFEITSP